MSPRSSSLFSCLTPTATSKIYTLSLHDALPILGGAEPPDPEEDSSQALFEELDALLEEGLGTILDRKSTRLNSSHMSNSYAVFCVKKKNAALRAAATQGGNDLQQRVVVLD